MKKLVWLELDAMAAFMDFAVGSLIAVLVDWALHVGIPPWYLPIGGVLAFLPDFDIIWPILRKFLTDRKIVGNHHETLMHRPLLVIPIATTIAYLIGGWYWAVTTFVCVLWHYVHDTQGFGGGGLTWGWPLSEKYWSLTGPHEPAMMDHDEWIRKFWMQLTPFSTRELLIGSVALGIAVGVQSHSPLAPLLLLFVIWSGFATVWKSAQSLAL